MFKKVSWVLSMTLLIAITEVVSLKNWCLEFYFIQLSCACPTPPRVSIVMLDPKREHQRIR